MRKSCNLIHFHGIRIIEIHDLRMTFRNESVAGVGSFSVFVNSGWFTDSRSRPTIEYGMKQYTMPGMWSPPLLF